ncbi:MAG TPA: DUF202 domain-containing protein [Lacisediminihabitans sp.]|uniref:DUF202 domain-containing protein n=1 Tax=Lacisediminihabitans sp. TaxID=2787631 RepID=UPI002ED7ECDD
MIDPDVPFDRGLQPERTLLAWRRTSLSFAVISAAGVRVASPVFGPVGAAAAFLALVLAVASYAFAGHRYRRVHEALVGGDVERVAAGAPLATMFVAALVLAALALGVVLVLGVA